MPSNEANLKFEQRRELLLLETEREKLVSEVKRLELEERHMLNLPESSIFISVAGVLL